METKIAITLTFSGDRKLKKSEVWEFIDQKLQYEFTEIGGQEFVVTVEKIKPKTK